MTFEPKESVDSIVIWWRALHPQDNGDRGDRAARAELRRAETLMDALMLPQTQWLLQAMRKTSLSAALDDNVILLAMVLAHVSSGTRPISFTQALGQTQDGKRPTDGNRQRLSTLRFGALMGAMSRDDLDARARALRRAVIMLKETPFDVRRFITDMLFFNDRTQRNWTYEYWQTFRSTGEDSTAASPSTDIETVSP